jgi:hypothetical protein
MDVDAREILAELQTLSAAEPVSTLSRLRELADAVDHAMAYGSSTRSARHTNFRCSWPPLKNASQLSKPKLGDNVIGEIEPRNGYIEFRWRLKTSSLILVASPHRNHRAPRPITLRGDTTANEVMPWMPAAYTDVIRRSRLPRSGNRLA